MDDLFAAIRAYLRRHNRRLERAPIERVWHDSLRPLALRRCRSCGGPIEAEGDVPALGVLLLARLCLGCYMQHEAA